MDHGNTFQPQDLEDGARVATSPSRSNFMIWRMTSVKQKILPSKNRSSSRAWQLSWKLSSREAAARRAGISKTMSPSSAIHICPGKAAKDRRQSTRSPRDHKIPTKFLRSRRPPERAPARLDEAKPVAESSCFRLLHFSVEAPLPVRTAVNFQLPSPRL
jgi:hypothetical protein